MVAGRPDDESGGRKGHEQDDSDNDSDVFLVRLKALLLFI